jgi:hypothetical protein
VKEREERERLLAVKAIQDEADRMDAIMQIGMLEAEQTEKEDVADLSLKLGKATEKDAATQMRPPATSDTTDIADGLAQTILEVEKEAETIRKTLTLDQTASDSPTHDTVQPPATEIPNTPAEDVMKPTTLFGKLGNLFKNYNPLSPDKKDTKSSGVVTQETVTEPEEQNMESERGEMTFAQEAELDAITKSPSVDNVGTEEETNNEEPVLTDDQKKKRDQIERRRQRELKRRDKRQKKRQRIKDGTNDDASSDPPSSSTTESREEEESTDKKKTVKKKTVKVPRKEFLDNPTLPDKRVRTPSQRFTPTKSPTRVKKKQKRREPTDEGVLQVLQNARDNVILDKTIAAQNLTALINH